MFARTKIRKNKNGSQTEYLQIVENYRQDGKIKQRVICTLGRIDQLQEDGQIDRLVEGLARFAVEQELILRSQDSLCVEWTKELGLGLVFRRLWEQCGLANILKSKVANTRIEFDAAEAIFAMVLNRLSHPKSKLQVHDWVGHDVYDPHFEGLELQHYYRALDFLAQHKDAIEEELFFRGKDLFNQSVDLVFFDTTSTYFEGSTSAEDLCRYGFSKDHRPDRVQVMIGLLIDQNGIPIAHEVLPGNTPDVEAFLHCIEACKKRFNLRRVVLVGDRGMASEKTIAAIEEAGLEYILGVKMRRGKDVQNQVLTRAGRFKKVEENLHVKNVELDGKRYVICLNPEEAERDARVREEVLQKLEYKLHTQGVKGLVGNRAYARYLKVNKDQAQVDESIVQDESRYDGKYILRTNTTLPTAEVAVAYKHLWMIERAFRELKSNLELRPMYHWTENRIRGHIMICFLAFYLEMQLRRCLSEIKPDANYVGVIKALSRLTASKIISNNKSAIIRTELQEDAYLAFKAVHMQVPSRVLQ